MDRIRVATVAHGACNPVRDRDSRGRLHIGPVTASPEIHDPAALDAKTRAQVIDAALAALREGYVFPDVAQEMARAVRAHQRRGDYRGLRSERAFAIQLTEDLRRVSHDEHLRVDYFPAMGADGPPGPPPPGQPPQGPPPGPGDHGITRVERLPGNIGLIAMRGFVPPSPGARDAIAEAMDAVHPTDALIFDMRQNGGGHPDMVALVCSYLFGPEPVQLSSFYGRDGALIDEFQTSEQVQGQRYGDKDVYVLTSARTFSGGEAFAYDLKHLDRATIIGETTGGGAHPMRGMPLPGNFGISVPFARPINPVTQTNWEGTGVIPDIAVPAEDALERALRADRN